MAIVELVCLKLNQNKNRFPLMFIRTLFISSNLFLLFGDLCSGLEQVTVTGARVNVRAVADLQGEIVGQVARGDVLSATGESKDGMVELVPPVSISVWVYSELIRDGVVAASSVRVRSGPGIGFRSVGKIGKGFEVEALETKGDWLRIVPPSSCRVWISEDFVRGEAVSQPVIVDETPVVVVEEPDAAPLEPVVIVQIKKPQPPIVRKPPAPVNELRKPESLLIIQPVPVIREPINIKSDKPIESIKPVVSDSDLNTADVVSTLKLVARAPQGKPIVVSGKIIPAGFFPLRRPSRYRLLVSSAGSPLKTGCYLVGDNDLLAGLSGHSVRIIGKKYWVQGVREPVVWVSEFCKPE